MSQNNPDLETLVSLAKRRGFIYQGSGIYGGLAGTWDYGPMGVELKRNLRDLWWRMFVAERDDVYGLDTAILMNQKVWQASGHTGAGFADPMVEDVVTGERYRADHLLEEHGVENGESLSLNEIDQIISQRGILSPSGNLLSQSREYNMMFETYAGAVQDETGKTYLRPETAQGMFVNFRNVVDSLYPDLPFGLAQTGRCFRNEISPREFLFRVREFEIMELEYFIEQHDWQKVFEDWRQEFYRWCEAAGLDTEKVHELDVPQEERAHYSDKTIDFEYEFSFGTKEIAAVAYRTDFDLGNHTEESGVNLQYPKKDRQERITPHVIEPTWGLDRNLLAVLSEAYREEDVEGETRVVLGLPFRLAPVKVAVFPLLQNKPELVEKARQVYQQLKKEFPEVMWDGSGNVGKRYRRQDEIGTPYCVTVDFDSLEDESVTVRDRDTMEQERVTIQSVTSYIASQ
jgi:glycyl-tRNA synthetase